MPITLYKKQSRFLEATTLQHGVGHPDPDDIRVRNGEDGGVHGCDGCCTERNEMFASGTEVKVDWYPDKKAIIVSSKSDDGDEKYLLEFPDQTRSWFSGCWVHLDTPEMKTLGALQLYDDIEVYETDDWTTLKVDGDIIYDHHNLDGADMLDLLDIKHKYVYIDDAGLFRRVVEGTGA